MSEPVDNPPISKELAERWNNVQRALLECLHEATKESIAYGQDEVWVPDWAVPLFENIPDDEEDDGESNQDERIEAALKRYQENPEDYTYADLEAIFEDRDPVEFL